MFQNRCYENERDNDINATITGSNNTIGIDMDVNTNMYNQPAMMHQHNAPLTGPVQERVVNRTFVHEVQHV